jgi:hypothetical protein
VQQTLLETNPNVSMRVYAIWFNMVPTDARARWRASLLPDARVLHFWDESQLSGRLFADVLPRFATRRAAQSIDIDGDILWDAYVIYDRDAHWDVDEAAPDVISWGSTILLTQETLRRTVLNALARP